MQSSPQQPVAQAAKPAPPPKPVPPPEFQSGKIAAMSEPDLVKLLQDSSATTFQKAKACERLASIGTKDSVPAVGSLLVDAQLATYARNALQNIPDPAADEALRAALPKLQGTLLVGVINSLGHRRDSNALAPLAKLLYASDPAVAEAAAFALGRIGDVDAAKALQAATTRTKGPVRVAVTHAGLLCAEALLASGRREEGLAFYNALNAAGVPKPVRLAAMHGIIAAETSLSRPR